MPRIGTSVRVSLRVAVRCKRNGLRLQKLSSANVNAGENLADAVRRLLNYGHLNYLLRSRPSKFTRSFQPTTSDPLFAELDAHNSTRLSSARHHGVASPLSNSFLAA
jgi:hypothetical protein